MNTRQRLARVQQDGHTALNAIYAALAVAVAHVVMSRSTPDLNGILRLTPPALPAILLEVGRLIDQARTQLITPAITQSIRDARVAAEFDVEPLPITAAVESDMQGFRVAALALLTDRASVLRQVGSLVGVGIARKLAASKVAQMAREYFFKRDPKTGLIQVWPGRTNMASQHARMVMLTETTAAHARAMLLLTKRDGMAVKWNLGAGHTEQDECDDKANQSSRGLSRGCYLPSEAPRLPTHPNCRCSYSSLSLSEAMA